MSKPRDLYIVATDRRDVYELLRRQFAGDPNVEVILDRRKGERRAVRRATREERRRADRRQTEQAHLLKNLGVVHVPDGRRDGAAPEREAPAKGNPPKPSRRRKGA